MRPESSYRSQVGISMDDIRRVAPSVFASAPDKNVSAKYRFIPTENVVNGMINAGFHPVAVSQSIARDTDRRQYARHMIRFQPTGAKMSIAGDSIPEAVLINAHDRSSAFHLMAGLFKLICSNGLIIAQSMIESINVRHAGNVIEEVVAGTQHLLERMPAVATAVERWKGIQLSIDHQVVMAQAASRIRFGDKSTIDVNLLLAARRPDDAGNDLWSVFNRLQENVLQGGIHANHGSLTRTIRAIPAQVNLNTSLWSIGERMAELVG